MEAKSKLHPVMWVAAVSVTVLSLAGVAAIMGIIPTVGSKNADITAAAPAAPAPAPVAMPAPAPEPVPAAPAPSASTPQKKHPVAHKAAPMPPDLAANAPAPIPAPPPAPAVCHECGTIQLVKEVEEKGEGTGLGAVGGALVGGVLGHQVGQGTGKDVATVLGAIGGGIAGHQIEKNAKKKVHYEIVVRFDDGTSKIFTEAQATTWQAGARVKVINGQITALN